MVEMDYRALMKAEMRKLVFYSLAIFSILSYDSVKMFNKADLTRSISLGPSTVKSAGNFLFISFSAICAAKAYLLDSSHFLIKRPNLECVKF